MLVVQETYHSLSSLDVEAAQDWILDVTSDRIEPIVAALEFQMSQLLHEFGHNAAHVMADCLSSAVVHFASPCSSHTQASMASTRFGAWNSVTIANEDVQAVFNLLDCFHILRLPGRIERPLIAVNAAQRQR